MLHSPRPSPSPRPQGGPGSWPTLFMLPMSASLQLCRSEQSPGLFLRKGRGLSGAGPRPAPVPHTMGQEQGSWEALQPRLHARRPRGRGAGRWGSVPRAKLGKWEPRCPAVPWAAVQQLWCGQWQGGQPEGQKGPSAASDQGRPSTWPSLATP